MIRISTAYPDFNRAYHNSRRALLVKSLESPKQYGERWCETHKCRIEPAQQTLPHTYYIFDRDEDYVMFMLRWA